MPRLNTAGQSVMGIAGEALSIDGVRPATFIGSQSGGWDWMSTTLLVGNADVGAGEHLYTYNTVGPVLTLVNAAATSATVGGGGLWAAFSPSLGVFTSSAASYPLAGLGDLSTTGELSIIQVYAADRGVQVYDNTDTRIFTQDVQINTISPLRNRAGILAFNANPAGPQLVTVSTGAPLAFAARTDTIVTTVPVSLSGAIWLLEWTVNDTLSIRPKDTGLGYVIATATPFNPDVIEISAGVARIAYSVTTGESITSLRVVDLNVGSGTTSVGTTAGGALSFSSGPRLKRKEFATTPSGGSTNLQGLLNHPISQPTTRLLTPEWQKWFAKLSFQNAQPIRLGIDTTGTLPPDQGGTGGGTGTSVINGENILSGTTPLTALESIPASTLVGRGDSGAGSPEVITLGSGLTMTAEVLSATGAGSDPSFGVIEVSGETDVVALVPTDTVEYVAGSGMVITTDAGATPPQVIFESTGGSGGCYIPLVDGSEPPVFITDGSGHLITVAYAP